MSNYMQEAIKFLDIVEKDVEPSQTIQYAAILLIIYPNVGRDMQKRIRVTVLDFYRKHSNNPAIYGWYQKDLIDSIHKLGLVD